MTKFKIGDKVRLKAGAKDWSDDEEGDKILKSKVFTVGDNSIYGYGSSSILECIECYPDDFEFADTAMAEDVSKRHVHHDMIVEWAANPTRIVQYRTSVNYPWTDCSDVTWNPNTEYRFKPTEPGRVFPKTSLGIKELVSHMISEHETVSIASLEAIANAAIKQYILDMEKA